MSTVIVILNVAGLVIVGWILGVIFPPPYLRRRKGSHR